MPNRYVLARRLAQVYLTQGAEAKALSVLESASAAQSEDAEFSALLGLLYQRAGRYDEAVSAYERALALNGHDARAWLGYAISLETAGRGGAARSAYRRASLAGLPATLSRYAERRLAALENR